MDVITRATTTTPTTTTATATAAASGGGGGMSIKSPEAESETPPRIQPFTFSNGVLKRHAPPPIIYKECLKNHAASLGGHALDGCGEFMPAPTATASDPTSLKCAACGCHRNFHRREPEDASTINHSNNNNNNNNNNAVTHVIEYHPHHRHHPLPPPPAVAASRGVRSPGGSHSPPPISSSYYPGSAPHMLLALSTGVAGVADNNHNNTPITNNGAHLHHQHQHHGHGHGHHQQISSQPGGSRKRFRTKFSQDQKDRMHEFAEKVGWKMQKTNEEMVNGFCNEIGVERGVFKVWMHNNKNTFGKRSTSTTPPPALNNNNCQDHNLVHGLNDDPTDEDDELANLNGNGNGNGNNSNNSSINNHTPNNHMHHHDHHHQHQHQHQHQQQYNGGKSNESNAPTNASSSSS